MIADKSVKVNLIVFDEADYSYEPQNAVAEKMARIMCAMSGSSQRIRLNIPRSKDR